MRRRDFQESRELLFMTKLAILNSDKDSENNGQGRRKVKDMIFGTHLNKQKTQKTIRSSAGFLILFFLMCLLSGAAVYADSAAEDDSTIDFVLVLDNSGTMARSDPDRLTVSAAKMFIDMLPEKNARVAVVEFGSDYGEDAYSGEKYTNYVSVPFPLSDITATDQKEACKNIIDRMTQDGKYTPVGYAFQAACDVLEKGGATPGDAGILLISDFRVTGQKKEDFLDGGYDYQSLADAEAIAAENEWPVYTLEMDFDGKNEHPSDYTERIAARIRSDIPNKVGYGDYVPLKNAEDAQARFAEIFRLFFDPDNEDGAQVQSQVTDDKGDAEFHFSVDGMVAELNVTLTSKDSSLIREIEIGHGDVMSAYDLTQYTEPIQEENRTITRDERHITIKTMVPAPGDDWKLFVHGEARTEIGMYALSVHDMNMQLKAAADSIEEGEHSITIRQNGSVQFTASYIYDGIVYDSSQVYSAYPAVLDVKETGEQIPMTAGEAEYSATVPFSVPGTYTVKAIASDSTFRTGSIESGEYTVVVEKKTIELNEDADLNESWTLGPGESVEVDCSQYFLNPDKIPLIYSVELQPESSDLTYVQDGNILKLKAGKSAAETTVTITAEDKDTAVAEEEATPPAAAKNTVSEEEETTVSAENKDTVQKELTVTVTNEPLTTLDHNSEPYIFARNQNSVPGFLKRFVDQSDKIDQSGNLRIEWSELFLDPDGYSPLVTVEEANPNGAFFAIEDKDGITFRAIHPGEATYEITARDANDPSVEQHATLRMTAYDAEDYAMQKIRIPVMILIIVLGAAAVLLIVLIIRKKR